MAADREMDQQIIEALAERSSDEAFRRCAAVVRKVVGPATRASVEQWLVGEQSLVGDASREDRTLQVYLALTRLAQPWVLRYPLVDGQGNFGSYDGDPPVDLPYTECRLSRFARLALDLPCGLPPLHALVNGTLYRGGVLPPHRLGDVIDALLRRIEGASGGDAGATLRPDFPTGGVLEGECLRGAADIVRSSEPGCVHAIRVSALPYGVLRRPWLEGVAGLLRRTGIANIRDESTFDGVAIYLDVARGDDPAVVLRVLEDQASWKRELRPYRARLEALLSSLRLPPDARATLERLAALNGDRRTELVG